VPTQITRSAVSGSPDNIQTEITVLDLSGTCDPGGIAVTVRQSPDRASTGKITEQQNDEPGVLEFKANSFFDVFFEVDVGGTILHNQEALRLECKIQEIPPYGCFYEPDVGTVTLYNADKKEVATLIHAAHIPLDPKQKLLIFTNEPKPPTTPTVTPGDVTPTPTPIGDVTPTVTPTPTDTPTDSPPTPTDAPPTPTLFPPTMLPTDTPTPGGDGDANKNGVVNAIDAALVLQGIAGLTDEWPNTDVNNDGTVNAIDAALLLQFIAGLIPGLPL
jgi:Dockerin type I domain